MLIPPKCAAREMIFTSRSAGEKRLLGCLSHRESTWFEPSPQPGARGGLGSLSASGLRFRVSVHSEIFRLLGGSDVFPDDGGVVYQTLPKYCGIEGGLFFFFALSAVPV